jgi:hypothetical protein
MFVFLVRGGREESLERQMFFFGLGDNTFELGDDIVEYYYFSKLFTGCSYVLYFKVLLDSVLHLLSLSLNCAVAINSKLRARTRRSITFLEV